MNNRFLPELSNSEWLVEERSWKPAEQALIESVLTLGNGYLGSRAILEELPEGSAPGTYFAGLYDAKNTQVTELVNAPNPVVFKVKVNEEQLDLSKMRAVSHYRALDMRQGILARKTVFVGKGGKRFQLESVRFFSLCEKHVAVMRVLVTPLDGPATLEVESYVDDSVTNKGTLTEGDKMHFITKEKCTAGKTNYLSDVTFEHGHILAYATQMRVRKGKSETAQTREKFTVRAGRNQTVCFTKYFAVNTTRDLPSGRGITSKNIKTKTIGLLKSAVRKGFDRILTEHQNAWRRGWEISDVRLDCAGEPQRAIRFNIYQLIILSNPDDEQASVGARALSAEHYKGHIFWDMELFMLPFYIYTDPAAARSFLMYRYNRLEPARKIAADRGYRGAQFPWESADIGVEVTPRHTMDLDGRVVRTIIGEEEHIVCDVGYAVWHYYFVTRDRQFMLKYGLEMLLETARFWISRVKYNSRKRYYEINGVMGCDEFHANTNNNAFTNGMARFNILAALECLKEFESTEPGAVRKCLKKIGLKAKAVAGWRRVANGIKKPPKRKDRVIEEFDGFFKLRYIRLPKRQRYYLPGLPKKDVSVKDLCKTQFVKQGDTVILLYLLPEDFDIQTKKANYYFYDARTLHKSSLSPSIYAIVGAELGDLNKAYNYFLACLYTDIHNLYGNTAGGIHAASLGAAWQVVVNGFAGMRVSPDKISFEPRIPDKIKGLRFALKWRGKILKVRARNDRISFLYEAGANQSTEVYVCGQPVALRGGASVSLTKIRGNKWQIKQ